jgi:hypothetical protein
MPRRPGEVILITVELEQTIRAEIAHQETAAKDLPPAEWAQIGAAVMSVQALRWVLVKAGLDA